MISVIVVVVSTEPPPSTARDPVFFTGKKEKLRGEAVFCWSQRIIIDRVFNPISHT
ncbi:MAG: hypothetical protein HS122_11840 [Opitutaceae bacterium]|nr:hypothetical protein [Opitutaceae bacterium]